MGWNLVPKQVSCPLTPVVWREREAGALKALQHSLFSELDLADKRKSEAAQTTLLCEHLFLVSFRKGSRVNQSVMLDRTDQLAGSLLNHTVAKET